MIQVQFKTFCLLQISVQKEGLVMDGHVRIAQVEHNKISSANQCKVCLVGTYQNQNGRLPCQTCPDGQYQDEE